MRFSNLHTHTTFSDGKNTVAENVEAAIEKNMLSIGFSDHSFTAIDPSYCMHTHRYKAYIDEVNAAKKEYEERNTGDDIIIDGDVTLDPEEIFGKNP